MTSRKILLQALLFHFSSIIGMHNSDNNSEAGSVISGVVGTVRAGQAPALAPKPAATVSKSGMGAAETAEAARIKQVQEIAAREKAAGARERSNSREDQPGCCGAKKKS